MKRLSMLFLASVCIGLAGCQLAPLAIQGAAQAGARANASNMQASTDADKLTVELAAPTTEKVFIQTAKTVVGRLDYQTTNVGSGMVMAQKRLVDRAITVFGKTEYQTTTVVLRLENDRAIEITVRTVGNTKVDLKAVAEEFKGLIQELYADNKS